MKTTPNSYHWLVVDGVNVRYRSAGDPTAPPVLLLHGIARSLEDWDGVFAKLAVDHRVISFDLPGFGLSERISDEYSLDSLARFILAALDELGERRPVHVVGNSLGGAVAMQLSAIAPERVRSLVLVNSAGFGREVTLALRIIGLGPVGRRLLQRKTRAAAYRTELSLFSDSAFASDERVDHAMRVGGNPAHNETLVAVASHLGTFWGIRRRWRKRLVPILAEQAKPTLVMWGDEDRVLPAKHLDFARKTFPHAQFHVFAGCGHMPQIEKAAEFDVVVRAFIHGVESEPEANTKAP